MTIQRVASLVRMPKETFLKPVRRCMTYREAKALARNPDRLVFYYRRHSKKFPPLLFEVIPTTKTPAEELAEEAIPAQGNAAATLTNALKQLDLFAERVNP